jgi:hypothetical protein
MLRTETSNAATIPAHRISSAITLLFCFIVSTSFGRFFDNPPTTATSRFFDRPFPQQPQRWCMMALLFGELPRPAPFAVVQDFLPQALTLQDSVAF